MEFWVFYIILAITLAVISVISFFFVRHYVQKDENYVGTLIICTTLIVVVLLTLFLVPLDVYSVSSSIGASGQQKNPETAKSLQNTVKVLYYIFYALIVFLGFVCLPFAYFYFEAGDEGREGRRPSTKRRVWRALYFTLFFVIAFAVFIGVAFIVKTFRNTPHEDDWKKRIIGRFSNADALLTFTVALLSLLGLLFYVPYAAYGLTALPIYLMKNRANTVEEEKRALLLEESELSTSHRAQQAESSARSRSVNNNTTLSKMSEKYGYASRHGNNLSTTRKDRQLQETERKLEENRLKQQALGSHSTLWTRCWNALGPFRVVLGIILLLLSLLIFAQNLINVIDRFINSTCKWSCGFSIDEHSPTIINPIDISLKFVSKAFPLDLIFYSIIVFYLFMCLIYAITSVGIRFFCIHLQDITAHGTPANALILAISCLAIAALTINTQLITAVPQYSTFGTQFYLSSDKLTSSVAAFLSTSSSPLYTLAAGVGHQATVVPAVIQQDGDNGDDINQEHMTSNALDMYFLGMDGDAFLYNEPTPRVDDHGDDDPEPTPDPDPKPDPEPKPDPDPKTAKKKACTLQHARKNDKCVPTQISTFMHKTHHYLPVFSIIHLFANLLFQLLFVGCFIYALCTKPKHRAIQSDDPDAPNFYR